VSAVSEWQNAFCGGAASGGDDAGHQRGALPDGGEVDAKEPVATVLEGRFAGGRKQSLSRRSRREGEAGSGRRRQSSATVAPGVPAHGRILRVLCVSARWVALREKGGTELALPKMDLPIARVEWEVFLPQQYKVADFGGDALPARLLPLSPINEESLPLVAYANSRGLGLGEVGGVVGWLSIRRVRRSPARG
jgi:hypothetical protein